ncbi:MAG TPA: M28 family peptidase [Pirellulales bacterium]|nr:M28 family peptidase [Pirellulales bacterium]
MAALLPMLAMAADDEQAVEHRLLESANYLASDGLEGRGVGTKGLDLAADFLARQFREAGLKTDLYDGLPFQKFKMTIGASIGPSNRIAFVGPPGTDGKDSRRLELKLGDEFNPLAIGGSGKFDLPLVFVGYGITGKEEKYDDYANIDVKGKVVIVLRHEPEQANPHSAFDGTKNSRHAPYTRKLSNAYEHGAAAVIFCNDDFDIQKNVSQLRKRWQAAVDALVEEDRKFKAIVKPADDVWKKHEDEIQTAAADIEKYSGQLQTAGDPLLAFDGAGPEVADGRNFPVLFCRRAVLDEVLQSASGTSLAQLEKEIDSGPTPQSRVLAGWRAVGETSVVRQEVEVKNVVGVLDGEGPHADETIVLGAHYDHLGWGGAGSAAPGVHEIHNGADDNASGTTVLAEVARHLAGRGKKLPRRLVFIAFTGEERGLVGSARYVRTPLFPLASTVAMINMDMVGRLQDEKLIVHGTGTASEFDALAERFGKQFGFQLTKKPTGFGPSDHSSFYGAKVPVLFFFTGSHKDYHRPSDDVDKLNIAGMRRVGQMVADIAIALAEAPARPHYEEVPGSGETLGGGGDRPYFGSIPDFSQEEPGYALTGVTKGGPAERGGIKAGDIIVQFGDSKIGNLEDFDSALRKFKAGDKVPVVVKRGAEQVKLEVTLDPPR